MCYFLKVTLPLQPVVELPAFNNLKIGDRHKDSIINRIYLLTSYQNPNLAIIKVIATKDNGITFNKEFKFTFNSFDSVDTICLQKVKEDPPPMTWYKVDAHLVRNVMSNNRSFNSNYNPNQNQNSLFS